MKISANTLEQPCSKKRCFPYLLETYSRDSLLGTVLSEALTSVKNGTSIDEAMSFAEKALLEKYVSEGRFLTDWQAEATAEMDADALKRFFTCVVKKRLDDGWEISAVRLKLSSSGVKDGEDITFETIADLVLRKLVSDKNGNSSYRFEIIFISRKNYTGTNPKAKVAKNLSENDISAIIARDAFKGSVKNNICVTRVFLYTKEESTDGVNKTRWENGYVSDINEMFMAVPASLIKEWNHEKAFNLIISMGELRAKAISCWECPYTDLCKQPLLEHHDGEAVSSTVRGDLRLNDQQSFAVKRFVEDDVPRLLLACGPGSGKTTTLVSIIARLIESGVAAKKICCLSYTVAAAKNLKTRIEDIVLSGIDSTFNTIDALAYDLLCRNDDVLGYTPVLIEGVGEYELVKKVLAPPYPKIAGLNYTYLEGNYGLINKFINLRKEWIKQGKDRNALALSDGTMPVYADALIERFEEFERLAKEENLLTFDDVREEAIRLLSDYPEVRDKEQGMFDYILVDEYQDVNPRADAFVRLLAEKSRLCVVGDDDQSIYGFNGSEVGCMREFTKNFPEAETIVLNDNYRSSKPVLDLANALIVNDTDRIGTEQVSHNSCDLTPVFYDFTGLKDGIDGLNAVVPDLIAEYGIENVAIVVRSNTAITKICEKATFPVAKLRRTVPQDAFACLIRGLLGYVLYGKPADLVRVFNALDGEWLESKMEHVSSGWVAELKNSTDETEKAVMDVIEMARARVDSGDDTLTFLKYIASGFGVENEPVIKEFLDDIDKNPALNSLVAFYSALDAKCTYGDGKKFMTGETGGVTLATCHDAKGMEWKAVVLYGLESFAPEKSKKIDMDEERRVLYVALTRAADSLTVIQTKKPSAKQDAKVVREFTAAYTSLFGAPLKGVEAKEKSA